MNWTEEEYRDYLAKREAETHTLSIEKFSESKNILFKCTIPLVPVTKKNHSQIITFGKRCPTCKRGTCSKLIPSKQYQKYKDEIRGYLVKLHNETGTISTPINLKCLFYTPTKRQSDLVGHLQSIQDLLVAYKVLADDCRDIVASTDGSMVLYDKENPRTEITITTRSDYEQWKKGES